MPFRSSLKVENFGLAIFPANKTFFDLFSLIKFIILPNLPILTRYEFLSYLNLLFLEKSIIKYLLFSLLIFLRTISEKSVSPKNNPIILF